MADKIKDEGGEPYPSSSAFATLLEDGDLDVVVRDLFVSGIPWYFRNADPHFEEFCDHFGSRLGIETDRLCVVGSARVGFAVSPDSFPRPFHPRSDLDVAIVSEELFDAAWLALVKWGHPRRFTLPAGEAEWMKDRQKEIFWGWLRPDVLQFKGLRFPQDLRPLRDVRARWFETFQSVGVSFPGTDLARREVTGRLYRSWDHLIRYQAEGLRRLRYELRRRRRAREDT
ncbi:MAG: hypothetical protein M3323_04255 [Actinomycetota bacterium]|nr:hypothetical protein [Actinomycetota bacterium]